MLGASSRLQTGGVAGNLALGTGAKLGSTEFTDSAINITTSDPELLANTFNTFSTSLSSLFASAGEQQSKQAETLKQILGELNQEAAKTDEQKRDRTVLWIVGLVILGVVAVFWRK